MWSNIRLNKSGDIHTVPTMTGEPEHVLQQVPPCWCGPRVVRRVNADDLIVHNCLTHPETNTDGIHVLVS